MSFYQNSTIRLSCWISLWCIFPLLMLNAQTETTPTKKTKVMSTKEAKLKKLQKNEKINKGNIRKISVNDVQKLKATSRIAKGELVKRLKKHQISDQPQTVVAQDGDYSYESVKGDPLKARIYTLKNGLKVYLSVNKDAPRIQTAIPVRAGGKNDPRETTGLAHYLEHMLFKGTNDIGSSNWEEEKVLLQKISDLYEEHLKIEDTAAKKAIYKQIDSLSHEASKYAIPNEYDKMISSLGAKGTNAYTSVEETVYINDIPSNELEKWLELEAERFRMMVLRLFHTELEVVYEEFNRSQDNDSRKASFAMYSELFKNHPYGTPVIGEGEHLKNPSMVNIHNYFKQYYVPNNMAIVLSGDLDYSKTIQLIDKYFGDMEPGEVPEFTFKPEEPITASKELEVFNQGPEFVNIAFRVDAGSGEKAALLGRLTDFLLSNGKAGLIDLNLVQGQKVLRGGSYFRDMNDYSVYTMYGYPREGQTLTEVKDLLLGQLEKIGKGEFDDWLLEAVITDFKLSEIKGYENNWRRSSAMLNAFTANRDWADVVSEIEVLDKMTKQEVMDFVKNTYKHNITVYKRNGEDKEVMKVDKPKITQVEMNRDNQSNFIQKFNKMETKSLSPVFLDYKKDIQKSKLTSGLDFNYIKNEINQTFNLYYILDMGTDHDKKMAVAVKYLPFLGTDKYTAAELQQEFYKLGVSFDVFSSTDRLYVSLSGLEESFEKGIDLFEHILANVQPDEKALTDMIDGILKERTDNKLNKNTIFWRALFNYGKYGETSSFTNILSEEELKALSAQELVDMIKSLTSYQHYVFYYGQNEAEAAKKVLNKYKKVYKMFKPYPEATKFEEVATDKNKVYFVPFDMVQTNILLLSKADKFNKEKVPYARVFGEYFGSGLSSIVFQEIREARALAYSAFATHSTPSKADESHYTWAYLGVQADKLPDAVKAMTDLMNDMPEAEAQFNGARNSLLKKIESERITKTQKFFNYLSAQRRGLDEDLRKDTYKVAKDMTMEDLKKFFNDNIKGNSYTYLIMGKKEDLDMDALKKLGDIEELSLEQIFNY